MSDYAKTVKQLRYCSKATVKDCMECEGYKETGDCVSQKLAKEAAGAIEELISFDIRNLPEGLYTVKNGVVYTARVKVSGGNILNLKTGESHWEDDRIVGGEQVFPMTRYSTGGRNGRRNMPIKEYTSTMTSTEPKKYQGIMRRLRFYWAVARWLWKHRKEPSFACPRQY